MANIGITISEWSPECRYSFKYAHLKRDGHYTTFSKASDASNAHNSGVTVRSSQGTDLSESVSWHEAAHFADKLPVGCCVAGELWIPGKPASAVKTAIKVQDPSLQFSAFALLRYVNPTRTGFLTPQQCAELPLEEVERICEAYGFDFVPFHINDAKSNEHLQTACKFECLASKDVEGYVMKNANLLDWHKLKPAKCIDLIITGYVPGEGKYVGQVGSLIVSTIDGFELAAVGGMADVDRRLFSESHFSKWHGRIIEVEYQRVDSKGRLRHPRFIRLRDIDDKDINRCTLDQDPDLVDYWRTKSLFGRCNQ